MGLSENYKKITEEIRAAERKAGRPEGSVQLIAVSKTKPIEDLEEAWALGQRVFGENHVQEIVEKKRLHPEYDFHMIGHLQRNKVKSVVGRVSLIHSVDSVRLAEEISKESLKQGIITEILLEVNAAQEESKYGFIPEELPERIREIAELPGIHVKGLMTVAPNVADPEENRPVFRRIAQLAVDIRAQNVDNIDMYELSMGMTNDFQTAIEEGATMVRIGTALFGARVIDKGVYHGEA